MLKADCLFRNEFERFFNSLSEIELTLLYRHIVDFDLWENNQKEWQDEFKGYLNKLSHDKYDLIIRNAEKIGII